MAENLNIPEELQGTFKRLMNRVPEKLRIDSHIQRIIQLYLKLGGENETIYRDHQVKGSGRGTPKESRSQCFGKTRYRR